MIASMNTLSSVAIFRVAAAVISATVLAGCAAAPLQPSSDTAEAILLVPVEHVRTTALQVLVDQGYYIRETNGDARIISTGYRQEMDSIWDWLLDFRFGVNRSRVDIALIPEGEHATLVSIYVTVEGKDSLFTAWRPYEAPLPQSAHNQLRLLKNALGLL